MYDICIKVESAFWWMKHSDRMANTLLIPYPRESKSLSWARNKYLYAVCNNKTQAKGRVQ